MPLTNSDMDQLATAIVPFVRDCIEKRQASMVKKLTKSVGDVFEAILKKRDASTVRQLQRHSEHLAALESRIQKLSRGG